jgi:outer membrane protein insertion porin family
MLLILLFSAAAFAVDERVYKVIITGNRSIDSAAVLKVVKSKVGEFLSHDTVDLDIKDIYKLGYFEDVKAESEKTDSGVILTFHVVEKPIVREIRINGNKEITTDKIRKEIDLKINGVYSAKELTNSLKKVKKLYTDDGYYLADITAKTEKRGKNELRIVFNISEGKKVLIKTIKFEGNKVISARKLRKAMQTKEKWFLSWITGAGAYKEDVLKNDVNIIADLYYNIGYINVKVGEPQVKLLNDKSGLVVTIAITEGDQFKNGDTDLKGDLLLSKDELRKKIKIQKGKVFSRAVLRDDVIALTDLYTDKGYAFANVTPLTKVTPETKTIDITFEIDKGDKVHIDRINISGNSKTRDKVIRREFKLAEGDLYSSGALKRTKQNLNNLGFFEEVNISTAKGSAENKLNLNAEVKEKSTGKFSIGGGYSSADGIIGQASIQQDNFLGLGLKAILSGSFGSKSSNYTLGLTDPYFLDSRWTLGGDVYRSERDYIDYTRRATGADIKAGYPISDDLSTFWLYRYEKKDIINLSTTLVQNPQLLTETSGTIGSIYGSLTLDKTDYRLDPSKGFNGTLSAEYAGIGGDQRFIRFIGESAVYHPFLWNTVFSLRGTLGYIMRNGKDIPIDEKFYLGGINTLRGYSTRSVCPYTNVITTDTTTGAPVTNRVFLGGVKEAVFNAEYVFPIIKDAGIRGLFFFDTGNSYGSGQKFFSTMRSSYGAGLRWYSPMGPLRLEYGIPINPRPGIDSSGGKLEFSIGGFF